MVGVVSAGIDTTRFQPGIRPRETQAEELRPDMRSVCELDDNTVLAQAIAILPARGEYSAICQCENAALSISERAFAETGEDRVAMQLSASGLDIATEHPCPAEVLQDLHARRHERTTVTRAQAPLCGGPKHAAARGTPLAELRPSVETALVQPKSQESRRQSAPRHLEW